MVSRFITVLLAIAICMYASSSQARDIVIGSINDDPKNEIETFLPIAKYLEEELRNDGITGSNVIITRSMEKMAELLLEGKVDLYIDSPYPILNVANMSGGVFFLRRWKDGQSGYHSVIFTRKDSPVTTINDLKGHLIAFEEPWSSSSYFLPKHSLLQHNMLLSEKKEFRQPTDADSVGYVFSYSDKNTVYWVLNNHISAGAMSEEKLKKHAKENIEDFRIIHRTFTIPRHVVLHRADLEPELVSRITETLIDMDNSEKGRAVLKAFENTTKFDPIPENSLKEMQSGLQFMRANAGK